MDGVAADDATKRHNTIVRPALLRRRIERQRNRDWNLQRPRDGNLLDRCARARIEEQDKGGDAARAALALVRLKRRLRKR